MANGCPNMVLEARVGSRWLIQKQVKVRAYCTLTRREVADPMIGCGQCHDERWQAIREAFYADDGERGT
jgi:hypothetical protein